MELNSVMSNEVSKPSVSENKSFDPDKRIDVNQKQDTKDSSGFDVDKRVEVNEKPLLERLECANEKLDGEEHPKTGVPFVCKEIDLGNRKVEGVFPVFDSVLDVKLPNDLLTESDKKQFNECNKQLKFEINENPSLKKMFSDEQIEQIMDGKTPDGYVWHHNEEVGKMQLVEFNTHDKTAHRGGKSIWGGGSECR